MKIILETADFSTNNIGNTRWSENWMIARGITDPAKKTAVRDFYNGMAANGLVSKFSFLYIFNSTLAILDKLNVLNPYDQVGTNRVAFYQDLASQHTVNGYTPDRANNRFAYLELEIQNAAQLNNFHLHIYNTTADSAGAYLSGAYINAGGSSLYLSLSRNVGGNTTGGVTVHNGAPVSATAGYDVTKTGLLSLTKAGTTQKLFDNGALIGGPATIAQAYTLATPQKLFVGTMGTAQQSWHSTATIKLVAGGYPSVPITDAEVGIFNSLVNALLAAL